MRLKPGTSREYRQLHERLPKTVTGQLRRAGATNYTIFQDGDDLFAYLETSDIERFRTVMREGAPKEGWTDAVRALFSVQSIDPAFGLPPRLAEVFRFDPAESRHERTPDSGDHEPP